MIKKTLSNQKGFTIVQVLIAVGIVAVFALTITTYIVSLNRSLRVARYVATKDRTIQGIRKIASMPAALRISMRASDGTNSVNPTLLACAGANPANACQSGIAVPFTLYSPLISRLSTGEIVGIQPVSAPLGSAQPFRLNSLGSQCSDTDLDCPFLIYTSIRPQCGAAALGVGVSATPADLTPVANCTVSEVIEVIYKITLDPQMATTDPTVYALVGSTDGSVVIKTVNISGNKPE